jgi:hypothetical protein
MSIIDGLWTIAEIQTDPLPIWPAASADARSALIWNPDRARR